MSLRTYVFFYGLFMDRDVLASKGIQETNGARGVVHDWMLKIGQRATMVPESGRTVHGVVMTLSLEELDRLYSEESVRMYRPVSIMVRTETGAVPALAYVLPTVPSADERNPEYAAKLRALAERLGLPPEYTGTIV